ncbi:MAG TPA: YeeE/YedE thiosulfate transporter family protein [Kofleriaceae bacterium]|nr:YeeE/YedE thiosulfate transporter family protein [Kofleriaceae bacterium]
MRARGSIIVAVAALALVAAPRRAPAQCEANASSCVDCHEVQGRHPVQDDGRPWHRDHAFGDLCVACHGGAPGATSQALAHAGMREPLAEPAAACGGCHSDAAARADRYRAIVAAGTAPTQPPTDGALSSPLPGTEPTPSASMPVPVPVPGSLSPSHAADRALAAASLLLAALIAWELMRHRKERHPTLLGRLRAPRWSPYAAGAGLGVVVALTEGLLRRPLSASAAFDKLAAYPGRALLPHEPYYAAHLMTPGITWPVWLMVGLLLGSFASSRLAHQAHAIWLPDAEWIPRFGPSRVRRLMIAFVGAALVQVGAGIAGGCTSGLAISGGALLSPAAFLFMAGMFAGGMPAAWWWYRRHG